MIAPEASRRDLSLPAPNKIKNYTCIIHIIQILYILYKNYTYEK